MQIIKIKNKNGENVSLGNFNVLVGPNNSGKSQTLRDIHNILIRHSVTSKLITDITIDKPSNFNELIEGLDISPEKDIHNLNLIKGISSNLRSGEQRDYDIDLLQKQFDEAENGNFIVRSIGVFKVSFLDAKSRLLVTSLTESANAHNDAPSNLLQALYLDTNQNIENKLNQIFNKTFKYNIKLDYSSLRNLSLKVAKKFGVIPSDPRKAVSKMKKFPNIEEEGDGYNSFVGVVLSLLLSKGRVVLLDEPEAFLHPAQARMLGKWIADHSNEFGSQIIIATHNSNFLAGILSSNAPTNIYRLNRSEDNTTFNMLPSKLTNEIANSHILSSQRVLEAIFYKGVVISESDSDRAVYQIVANKHINNYDYMFIHAHNKQTIQNITPLFVQANINVKVIVDIDILNDKKDFSNLLKTLTSDDISDLSNKRKIISDVILGKESESDLFNNLTNDINILNKEIKDKKHDFSGVKTRLDIIRKNAGLKGSWKSVKKKGIKGIPSKVKKQTLEVFQVLKNYGIYIVPLGELEGWFSSIGYAKGAKFTIEALKLLNKGKCSTELRDFIREIVET